MSTLHALAFEKDEFVVTIFALKKQHRHQSCACGRDVALIVCSRKPSGRYLLLSFTSTEGPLGGHFLQATSDADALAKAIAWAEPIKAHEATVRLDRFDVMSADPAAITQRINALGRFGVAYHLGGSA